MKFNKIYKILIIINRFIIVNHAKKLQNKQLIINIMNYKKLKKQAKLNNNFFNRN